MLGQWVPVTFILLIYESHFELWKELGRDKLSFSRTSFEKHVCMCVRDRQKDRLWAFVYVWKVKGGLAFMSWFWFSNICSGNGIQSLPPNASPCLCVWGVMGVYPG